MIEEKGSDKTELKMVIEICLCAGCPTYKDCGKEGYKKELGFCFNTIGKSECISKGRGCICGGCKYHMKMKFKNFYYCINGSEVVQER